MTLKQSAEQDFLNKFVCHCVPALYSIKVITVDLAKSSQLAWNRQQHFIFFFLQSKFVKTVVNQHWDSGKARLKIFTSVGATPHRRQWEMWSINIYMGQKWRQLETIWAGITATELSLKFSIQCFVHSLGPGEEQRSSDKEIFFRFVLSLVTQTFYFLNKMSHECSETAKVLQLILNLDICWWMQLTHIFHSLQLYQAQ